MKIRIEGDSVRFRLRRSEVETLGREGEVSQTTAFPEGVFTYRVKLSEEYKQLGASFTNREICLLLPADWGRGWSGNSRVGYSGSIKATNGVSLDLLIEKDFVCLDRDPSGQTDQYPNPKADSV